MNMPMYCQATLHDMVCQSLKLPLSTNCQPLGIAEIQALRDQIWLCTNIGGVVVGNDSEQSM
jgi:hypothetical protein